MAVISKDLGAVTAYAAAVNRGYTGTKEEFETLMASYATVAQQAAESAGNASQSAQSASQSATDAETAKGTAQQAATDTQSAQASAQESAQSAQQSAQSASQSAQTAESAKETAVDAVDGFAAGAQQALDGVNQAGNNWKSLAQAQKLDAEAWAVGTRDGEDVGSSDPAYHNNAKYYAESVSASAQTASEAAQTATVKAGEAAQSASAAAESAASLVVDTEPTEGSTRPVASGAVYDLSEELNDVKSAELGISNVTFVPVDGKFINNSGSEITSNNAARSPVLAVASGTIVVFTAVGYLTNVAMIALSDENGTNFTPVSISTDSTRRTYTYTATEDCYVVVSYLKSQPCELVFKSGQNNAALDSRVTAIENENVPLLADAIGIDVIADNVSVTIDKTGKYVNNNGDLVSSVHLNLSTEITLEKGQTITFNAIGLSTSVSLLARVNSSGAAKPYAPIIVSSDNLEHVFFYTAMIDMTVVISFLKTVTPKYTISTSNIQMQVANVNSLKRGWVAFATMGVIGDSLASGASNYTGGVSDRPNYSWGKCIEREHGIAVSLFSYGGATTRTWLTNSNGAAALNSGGVLDCYIIGLGVNDAYSLGANYLGTINDVHVGSESENADTYYGNYSKIIALIKAKSPRAKIICLTNPNTPSANVTDYNEAVRTVAALYTCTYVVDLTEDSFYSSIEYKATSYGAHSTALGYKLIAENLYQHLATLMQDNISDFLDIQWIAENHG